MKNLALIFPGQGAQYVGMGKELVDHYHIARCVFEEANDVLKVDVKKLCLEGDMQELTKTENTQPALLTLSVAAYRVFEEEVGLQPAYTAGHSLGEFSALTCAGVISFTDALQLVKKRGLFMKEAAAEGSGLMCAVIGMSKEEVEGVCKQVSTTEHFAVISNYNAPEQIVISGHRQEVQKAADVLKNKGARISVLKVSAAFHSPLMRSAAIKLEMELNKYHYGAFKWPILSNVTAQPYFNPKDVIGNLTTQMFSPVKWDESVLYLSQQGIDTAIELGPKKVLTNLMRYNDSQFISYPFEKLVDIQKVKKELETDIEMEKSNKKVKNVVTKCLAVAVCTRNRNWDQTLYEEGVIKPYQKIKQIQDKLDETGESPNLEQMKEALFLIKTIFDTKRTPMEEQIERFHGILQDSGTVLVLNEFVQTSILHLGGEKIGFQLN
ncbi:ACP S-malonyltransferase [Chengkuizengella sediminis]|uniref:ACP S-malonyltransferase n=1 Tax=Chengkuizengella sediminis TaxID=1885917 RepID=UPI001389BA74|nr:ACP S-malonyltransferase [Chengkuizengella sediminis]NDI34211.1 ACP S-malonyltransferase [Chengkuizengella sediminis]